MDRKLVQFTNDCLLSLLNDKLHIVTTQLKVFLERIKSEEKFYGVVNGGYYIMYEKARETEQL